MTNDPNDKQNPEPGSRFSGPLPRQHDPVLIINGKRLIFKRGLDEIEQSTDKTVREIYQEAIAHIIEVETQLAAGKIEDGDGLIRQGLDRIANGQADFNISSDYDWRFAFMVFNGRPTIYLNPSIQADKEADFLEMQQIVRRTGKHDFDFWARAARMMF